TPRLPVRLPSPPTAATTNWRSPGAADLIAARSLSLAARRRTPVGAAARQAAYPPAPQGSLPAPTAGEYSRPSWCGSQTPPRFACPSSPDRPHPSLAEFGLGAPSATIL